MKQEVANYVAKSLAYQQVKTEHQRLSRLLQPLEFSKWRWDSVFMDFMVEFPLKQIKNNAVWVIVDRLIKTTHFIAMRNT